jgi:hypothetical protein
VEQAFTRAQGRRIFRPRSRRSEGLAILSRGEGRPSETEAETAPDRAGDLQFVVVAAAILAVILLFNALNVAHERAGSGHPVRFWEPIVWEGTSGVYFLAILPGVLAYARRFWPLRPPVYRNLGLQLAGAVAASLGHVVAIGAMRWAAYRALGGFYDPLGPLEDWPYELRKDLLAYGSWVAVYVMWRKLRVRRAAAAEGDRDVLEVRDGARRHFVPLSEVVWVEAAGNYVELHRGASGLLHRASLADMERRLEGAGFIRIHRSRLVRRSAVAAVESKPTGDFTVRLADGRELAGSRRYRRPLIAD